MPGWWRRRLGLFVHAGLASVPAWSPLGHHPEWYRAHLGEEVPGRRAVTPLVEVLAHHRDRWGHVERYDDFADLLTFDRFDAEAVVRLASVSGAGYLVAVAKHRDGWTWWDAPNTVRRLTERGPRRDVLAELAAACERNDVVLGTSYAPADWSDERYPGDAYVDEVLHPHVVDLVERYGSRYLWADAEPTDASPTWRSDELLRRVREIDPGLVANDRWWPLADSGPSVRTFDGHVPDEIVDGPWELRRGLGRGIGRNRLEPPEHRLAAHDVVAVLTEVVAKGGNLLLGIDPGADGAIPDEQIAVLTTAGTWVRRHADLLAEARPWSIWGDAGVRYLVAGGVLHAVDVAGRARFAELDARHHRVVGVVQLGRAEETGQDERAADATPVGFHQDDAGLVVETPRRRPSDGLDVAVYRIRVEEVDEPIRLFPPADEEPVDLADVLADARPGDTVQLGDREYRGGVTVPAGVVVRGLGWSRTAVVGDGPEPTVTLARGARIEHLAVRAGARYGDERPPTVDLVDRFAIVLGVDVDGTIRVTGHDALVRATRAQSVEVAGADRFVLSRCSIGGIGSGVGVHVEGGSDHEIESCDIDDVECAVHLVGTTGGVVRGNTIESRWWAIRLQATEGCHVVGNRIRATMRAVDVDGGTHACVDGNAVLDGDSGCIVQGGASECDVSGNHWERCRIGMLVWGAPGLRHRDNRVTDLREPDAALVTGP